MRCEIKAQTQKKDTLAITSVRALQDCDADDNVLVHPPQRPLNNYGYLSSTSKIQSITSGASALLSRKTYVQLWGVNTDILPHYIFQFLLCAVLLYSPTLLLTSQIAQMQNVCLMVLICCSYTANCSDAERKFECFKFQCMTFEFCCFLFSPIDIQYNI